MDWDRRYRIMMLHSAAHLLYYAMQKNSLKNAEQQAQA